MSRQDELDGVFAAVERRDSEFIADWLERHAHPDIEFTSVLTSGVEGRVYRGRQGLRDWASDVIEAVQISYGELEFREVGDDVVTVLVRPRLRGRGSGIEIPFEVGFVFEYEGDLVRRGVSYASHAEALAAAEALVA